VRLVLRLRSLVRLFSFGGYGLALAALALMTATQAESQGEYKHFFFCEGKGIVHICLCGHELRLDVNIC